ncbi:hypothetical protein ABK040_013143 [Willaertia magna]
MSVNVLQDGLIHLSQIIEPIHQIAIIKHIITNESQNFDLNSEKRANILCSNSLSAENCNLLHTLAQQWLQLAHEHCPSITPKEELNLIRLNYYPPTGKIGYHADTIPNMSTEDHLKYTNPVVSISLGNDAIFLYKNDLKEKEEKEIYLKSGDVVIFGGPSRMIFHSVPKIFPETIINKELMEVMSEFVNGRFNITMRNEFKFKEEDKYLPLTGREESGKYLSAHAIKAGVNLSMVIEKSKQKMK